MIILIEDETRTPISRWIEWIRVDRQLLKDFKDIESTIDVGLVLEAFGTVLKDTERHGKTRKDTISTMQR